MKTALLLMPATATLMDDSSTLLSVSSQSSAAASLMSAVGHRNVTAMEALIQELADESVNEPGWKFDTDIQEALKAIRNMFVKSIQTALMDQHKADQEHFNCFTKDCFGNCIKQYTDTIDECRGMQQTCDNDAELHVTCRKTVYESYKKMAKKCGELHCYEIPDPPCPDEKCTCTDLTYCHKKSGSAEVCTARSGDCKGQFGGWLGSMITKYQTAYEEWESLYTQCTSLYHEFLLEDMECDVKQQNFEKCMCRKNACEDQACNVEYDQCEAQCWGKYESLVKEKQCLEKDRKIDWSATKKIECYIDVLLHPYTEDELLKKCGTNDCINKAREVDYKHCASICPQVDYDGFWPEVHSVNPVQVAGHTKRDRKDQYHLGDGSFDCDVNGDAVFTMHRGGTHREGEERCTEHLDIDYQIPQCMACVDPPEPICDASFHLKWYHRFDDTTRIGCISDCCQENGASCFDAEELPSSSTGLEPVDKIKVTEHSHAWAYNRCPCTPCAEGTPSYPGRPPNRQCGMGAHTIIPSKKAPYQSERLEFKNVCIGATGDNFASLKVEHDVCVEKITFKHLSGQVTCREDKDIIHRWTTTTHHTTGFWWWRKTVTRTHHHSKVIGVDSGKSNWGCEGDALGLVLADGDAITAPVFDATVGMTPHYQSHAHWYSMDGVRGTSEAMTWIFNKPVVFNGASDYSGSKEYRLWYNEDLTGGTEHDNSGAACYDVVMEPASTCNDLAPLQFTSICTSAHGDNFATITLPEHTCVTEIAVHHIDGYVSCAGEGGRSNFGCGDNSIGLVFTKAGEKTVLMPHAGQVEGVTEHGSSHAHWYDMSGVGRNTRTLSMKAKKPVKVSGALNLWYNEDLTGGTESDNAGTACYEVAVHRAHTC